jgi:hypothetical protein
MDAVMLVATFVFFGVSALYVVACDRLSKGK